MRPLEILKFVLLITCVIGRLLQIWMIDSQMQPLKSSMSESDICLWTYFYVFKKLSVAFWFVILDSYWLDEQKRCNLYYMPWRDDHSKEVNLWTSFSCALPSIMAGETAYLPYMQSTGCTTWKRNKFIWISVRCSSTR